MHGLSPERGNRRRAVARATRACGAGRAARPAAGARDPARGQPHAAPRARDTVLSGFTYKLKWPGSDHAMYVTINDTFEEGQRRPFEIFINSKNLEHYAWTVALTRMISAIFRRGGDVSFVVEELKAVFDPRGGAWTNGKYVPSLLAAIGEIIEQHFLHIGFQTEGDAGRAEPRRGRRAVRSRRPFANRRRFLSALRIAQHDLSGGVPRVQELWSFQMQLTAKLKKSCSTFAQLAQIPCTQHNGAQSAHRGGC